MSPPARVPRLVICLLALCLISFGREVQGLTVSPDSGLTATSPAAETDPGTESGTATETPPPASPTFTETPPVQAASGASSLNEANSSITTESGRPLGTKPTTTPTPSPQISLPHLRGDFSNDEVLVSLKSSATLTNIHQCLQALPHRVGANMEKLNAYLIKIPAGKVALAIAYLDNCKGIRTVEPDFIAHVSDVIPNDPRWGGQYGLVAIRAPQGWQYSTGSASVTIAIVDTGIQLSHPDLAGKITPGFNFINGTSNANDDNGHGTFIAGIAAATTNNGIGVAGVSWGARLMPVKVLNASGSGTYADVAQGIIWATDHGAQVINLSLGGTSPSFVLENAVDYAYSHGVTLAAASGNTGSNVVEYPAHYPHVIAVAATDASNNRWPSSNFGPQLSLSAPGVSIQSTDIGGYGYGTGTSAATAFVSGLAAILRGLPGGGSPDTIAWIMEHTALDLGAPGYDIYTGYGLIQMDKAILLANPPTAGQNSQVLSYGIPLPLPTFTPTFTLTPEATQTGTATFTITPSLTAAATTTTTVPATLTGTPEVTAQQAAPPWSGVNLTNWQIPCCGGLLILLGLVVLGYTSRKRRSSRTYFKFEPYYRKPH